MPSRRTTIISLAFACVVLVALVVQPILGLALAALGIILVVFRRIHAVDATAVLTVLIVALAFIPARYVLPSLGAVGRPAGIIAIAAGYWWMLERFVPRRNAPRDEPDEKLLQPVLVALGFFAVSVGLTFAIAFSRPLTSVEASGTSRQLISTIGLIGIAALAADGIRSRARFDILVNRLLNVGAGMAAIAVVQFFTDFDPVTQWTIPGLTLNQDLNEVATRSVVDRVASTTLHPIEFGAVLSILFPLALHRALYAGESDKRWAWIRLILITFAIPFSVSRTAAIVLLVTFLMLWPVWTWARRLRVATAAVVFALAMRTLVPGLLGTIRALFTNWGSDPSVQGRTADYGQVWQYISQRPVLGRGLGTFDPLQYFFVDNEILVTLISGGVVGLLGLLALVFCSAALARQVYWHAADEETRHLGAALAAGIVGGLAGFLTFDALGFPTFASIMFLYLGLAGALWRLEVAPNGRQYTSARSRVPARA